MNFVYISTYWCAEVLLCIAAVPASQTAIHQMLSSQHSRGTKGHTGESLWHYPWNRTGGTQQVKLSKLKYIYWENHVTVTITFKT